VTSNPDFKVTILFDVKKSENGTRFRAIVTMADQYKSHGLSNGAIFNDLEQPLTQISRSRKYLTLNMSLTVQKRHYIYADNGYLVRTSALLIGVILNDLERAGVTYKIFS